MDAAMDAGSGAWSRGRVGARGSGGAHSKARDSLRSGRERRAVRARVGAAESKGTAVDEHRYDFLALLFDIGDSGFHATERIKAAPERHASVQCTSSVSTHL